MKNRLMLLLLTFFVVSLFFVNIFFGSVHIPYNAVFDSLLGRLDGSDITSYIIYENRIPQAITAMLSGAALGVTGLMLQTAFRNPLAGPSILGISSGASLGVALVILLFGGMFSIGNATIGGYVAIMIGAIAGALTITLILTIISMRVKGALMLLIVGIMTGYLTSSIVTLLTSFSSANALQGYVFWGMGSFSAVSKAQIPLFSSLLLITMFIAYLMAKPLNILLLGNDYARNLGVRIGRVRTRLLIITGLLTAIVTSYCGPISFIGLAMPHMARMILHTDNHWLLMPATMLMGAIVALACCILSVLPSYAIPINALTPIVGVPVILYVILSPHRRG